ncbi:recombinase family protein [Streptomyces sp. NPDC059564]|uniref:recombinase family protein n=1 Tax=Streptomyces sp. NPDC059564 TaxID=3346865 RepID=UPI00367D4174
MNLREWVKARGMHPQTAHRWFHEGDLPAPVERVGPRTIVVNVDARAVLGIVGDVGLYACVSSHGQKSDLVRRTARFSAWAATFAAGRLMVVLDNGEARDDLVRDALELPTWFCARLYGRRSAKRRARKAMDAAAEDG